MRASKGITVVVRFFARSGYSPTVRQPIPFPPQRNTHGEFRADTTEARVRFQSSELQEETSSEPALDSFIGEWCDTTTAGSLADTAELLCDFQSDKTSGSSLTSQADTVLRTTVVVTSKLEADFIQSSRNCSLGRSASFVSGDERISVPRLRIR